MILSCNSCGKKFVVPDQAIGVEGRLVQCGSCGNKWKQFPLNNKVKKVLPAKKKISPKTESKLPLKKASRPNIKKKSKKREIDLYSPEYLAKKHGIALKDDVRTASKKDTPSFGFYNSLILLVVLVIAISKGLHFAQDLIIQELPFTEFYIDYFFESIRNMFEIWKSLISGY